MKNRYCKGAACSNRLPFQPVHKFIPSAGGKVRSFGCDARYSLRNQRAWQALHPKGALRHLVFKQADCKFLHKAAFRKGLCRSKAFAEQLSGEAYSAHSRRRGALRQNRRSGLRCGMCGVRLTLSGGTAEAYTAQQKTR